MSKIFLKTHAVLFNLISIILISSAPHPPHILFLQQKPLIRRKSIVVTRCRLSWDGRELIRISKPFWRTASYIKIKDSPQKGSSYTSRERFNRGVSCDKLQGVLGRVTPMCIRQSHVLRLDVQSAGNSCYGITCTKKERVLFQLGWNDK